MPASWFICVPWDPRPGRDQSASAIRQSPVLVPASNTGGHPLSDDELLDEIEAAVQVRRAHSLRALDEITPTATTCHWALAPEGDAQAKA